MAERGKDETTFVGRRIGALLKEAREKLGLSVKDVAAGGFMSRQKIWRLEGGQGPYKQPDILALCTRYRIEPSGRYRLQELTLKARENSWHEPYGSRFGLYLETEQQAEAITVVAEPLINGLFQTPDYHRAVAGLAPPVNSVEMEVDLRQRRQELFWAREDVHLVVLMDESALVRGLGSDAVMRTQVSRLKELAERPRTSIRYLPLSTPNAAYHGSFTVMTIDAAETVVYTEGLDGARWFSESQIVARYEAVADSVLARSVDIRERE
jgi:transcriptional regulator with XRE-family HTH domain